MLKHMVQVRICETFDILRVQFSLVCMVLVKKVLRIQLDTGLMKLRLIMFILKVHFNKVLRFLVDTVLRVRIIRVFWVKINTLFRFQFHTLVRLQFNTVLRFWITTVFWVQFYTLLRVS